MKFLPPFFLILFFVSGSVLAEKALPPELILPVDATKNMSKDAISLTWQKPANESTAKILGYRLIVSENSRFFGYNPSSDSCNNSCQLFIEDKSTFKKIINVKLANKPYYWKVQAFNSIGNGDWSMTNTFQTQKNLLIPIITTAWVNPMAVLKGNSLTFSANLDVVLPEKYSVKLDYGNGLITMTGSGTNYSVVQTPAFIGKKDFTVGVYDAFNKLKGSVFSNSFTVIKGNEKPTVNVIENSATATTGTVYTAKFSANDVDGNLNSILIDWGDGATDALDATNNETKIFTHVYQSAGVYSILANAIDNAEAKSDDLTLTLTVSDAPKIQPIPTVSNINVSPQSVVSGNSLTFSASLSANLPSGYSVKINYGNGLIAMTGSGTNFTLTAIPQSSAAYKIGIYDSNNTLKSNQLTGNFSVTQPAPVVIITPPVEIKTTGYSKIANNGSVLSDSAKLGTAPTDWACTKDNKTGLIWEVKTDDGGLRDLNKIYTNYTSDYPKCDDAIWAGKCKEYGFTGKYGDNTNTDGFVTLVNAQSLCGKNDWRLPTKDELRGIVKSGKPAIDTTYFPNTQSELFFTSTPMSDGIAWGVEFDSHWSVFGIGHLDNGYNVRLVRE